MSHYKNIFTGEYIMTEVNALRHFIKLGKTAIKSNDIMQMNNVYKLASIHLNVDKCYNCVHDDFGYCEYRGKYSINPDEHFKICFKNWVHVLELELNKTVKCKKKKA